MPDMFIGRMWGLRKVNWVWERKIGMLSSLFFTCPVNVWKLERFYD